MDIQVVVPPPVEPVTVAEAFFQLKLAAEPDADVEDDPQYREVLRAITTAREQCEQITRRAFVQQTLRLVRGPAARGSERRGLAWYMNGGRGDWSEIELLRPPFISIASVSYYDDANTLQVVDPDDYYVSAGLVPVLRFVEGFAAPSTYIRSDALAIEYVAGYPPVQAVVGPPALPIDYRANVPESIKTAIVIGAQLILDPLTPADRAAMEKAQMALLSSFRVHTF